MINPQSILDLPMESNDAEASTVREYLITLLLEVWDEGEGFDGKRPFGNSGWEMDLILPLIAAGIIPGSLDEDGCLEDVDREDEEYGMRLIRSAIISLGWVESPEPTTFA